MYVQKRSWLENGPGRRRRRGLGETVTIPQLQATFDGLSTPQGVLVPDRLDQTTVSDSAYSFLNSLTGTCVFGADPSNPNCLSDMGLAQQQQTQQRTAAGGGAGGFNLNYVIYGGVGLVVVMMMARR